MTKIFLFACSTLIINALPFSTYGEDWPAWRGKLGDGTINDTICSSRLEAAGRSGMENTNPGKGHASPIIIGERIYLVAVMEETETRELLCLDRKSGKELWRKVVLKSPLERVHRLNSRASSTPSCDGERIYLSFLDQNHMFVAAYDLDGNKLWECARAYSPAYMAIALPRSMERQGDREWRPRRSGISRRPRQEDRQDDLEDGSPQQHAQLLHPVAANHRGAQPVDPVGQSLCRQLRPRHRKFALDQRRPNSAIRRLPSLHGDLLFMTCGFPSASCRPSAPTVPGT